MGDRYWLLVRGSVRTWVTLWVQDIGNTQGPWRVIVSGGGFVVEERVALNLGVAEALGAGGVAEPAESRSAAQILRADGRVVRGYLVSF